MTAIAKPWLKFYEAHVPERIEYPQTVLPAVLAEMAHDYPDHPALIFKGTRISYGELNAAVDRFAAALQGLGVKPGDRVALHLPNCPQFVIAYYAILRAGAIVAPCNPIYQDHELVHQLKDSGAEVIVTLSSTYPLIKKIRAQTTLRHVIVAEIKTYFPALLWWLFTLLMEQKKGHRVSIAGDENTWWFTTLLEEALEHPDPVKISGDDTAVLLYTGGTTGLSKGAELTHRNIFVNAYQCKVWLNAAPAKEVSLAQVPLFHAYGMTTCMNLGVLIGSTIILIPDPRDIKDVVKAIDKYHPTLYAGVPAMYNALVNFPELDKYNLSSLRVCICGAASMPVEVQRRFEKLTGAHIAEAYGLSEATTGVCANPLFGDNRLGMIGLPWPDVEVKVVDAEGGLQALEYGQVGELCVRGPQVMKGYWKRPDETAKTLQDHGDGGGLWLHTGDLVTLDADGYLKVVDRKKDMILGGGGYNIYPREIEDVLYEHPKVLQAGAIGVPVAGKGERVKVFVVLKPGEHVTEADIKAFCREHLAPYKVPTFVEFRDSLPMTITGKILRRKLREEEFARTHSQIAA
jgi:long-chain acyl-CoA synthetase